MKKKILLLILLSCSLSLTAQNNSFEERTAEVAHRIDSITFAEKSTLKKELKKIDKKLKKKEISNETANSEKNRIAEYHAKRINDAIFIEEKKMQTLIKDRVSGKLDLEEGEQKKSNRFFTVFYDSKDNFYNDTVTGLKVEKRFTSQFVIALGLNIVFNDDKGFYGDGFKDNLGSYGEVGFSFKYRLKEESNLWNFKFGFSTMVYELRPQSKNEILVTNQNQTTVQNSGLELKRSYFSSISIGIPIHLELDFSKPQYDKKTNQTYLHSQRGFRFGVGGYFAARITSSQFIRYNDEDGKRIRLYQNDNFNASNINFGPSAYVGYRDYSVYFKYDVNPVFKNNPQDINTLSIGLRADFN